MQKRFDKVLADENKEIFCLKNHSQNMITQIKKLKSENKLQQETLEQITHKESMIEKETMANLVEIKKLLDVKFQTFEKRINTNLIKILSTN
jgi:hypothetical protein